MHCSWWVHPIAAYRDGIVGVPGPGPGITTDGDRVFAILMAPDEDLQARSSEDSTIIYRPRFTRADRTKLLRNRNAVRVLRGAGSASGLGPEVGVRYEGLYQVERWSLHMVLGRRGREDLQYTLVLQPSVPEWAVVDVGGHNLPTAVGPPDLDHEEKADWEDYVRERDERVLDVAELVAGGWHGELVWMEREDGQERRDSGYAEGGEEGKRAGKRRQKAKPRLWTSDWD